MKVGITGQAGFIGTHLYNHLGLNPNFDRIPFYDSYFNDNHALREFVKQCDVIVHLAALNRDPDPQVIYDTNIALVNKLIEAIESENVKPHIIFSSSTQEERENLYGKSKHDGRLLFENWAVRNGAAFTGIVIPNVYGPFSKPNYNTFVATFAHKLVNGEEPQILTDNNVGLIYVGNLCKFIINTITENNEQSVKRTEVPADFEIKVSELLQLFQHFNECYFQNGYIPDLKDKNEINLFNTFRSYLDYPSKFPIKLKKNEDNRGVFVETLKTGTCGQVSFSTTLPGITRGNHYHTRKIERFTVIRGKARIQLRRIGTNEIIDLFLDGNEPAYVDMPVWYTHNITNIGNDELYTQFWINEWYNPLDGDTYYEEV